MYFCSIISQQQLEAIVANSKKKSYAQNYTVSSVRIDYFLSKILFLQRSRD